MIVVIPARGGSKRIPGKNIKLFNGEPILSTTIKKIKQFDFIEDIIVSTDDFKIKTVAENLGIKVRNLRPQNLSTDLVDTLSVMKYEIANFIDDLSSESLVSCVYPTSVFINEKDFFLSTKIAKNHHEGFVISAGKYDHPIQRAFKVGKDGRIFHDSMFNIVARTQDLSPYFHDAGQFYTGTVSTWRNSESIINNTTIAIELPPWSYIDIDEPEDWEMAEIVHKISLSGK